MTIKYYPNWDKLILYKAELYKKGHPYIRKGSLEEKRLAGIAGVNLDEVEKEQADFIEGA